MSMLPALLRAIRLFKVYHESGWSVYTADFEMIWKVACQFAGETHQCPYCRKQFLGVDHDRR